MKREIVIVWASDESPNGPWEKLGEGTRQDYEGVPTIFRITEFRYIRLDQVLV